MPAASESGDERLDGLSAIDRVSAWSGDRQQQQGTGDRYVLVEMNHVVHTLATEHRPLMMGDHGGGQRV